MGGSRSGRNLCKSGAGRPPGKKKDGRGRQPRESPIGQKAYSQLSGEEKLLYHQQAAKQSKGYISAPPPASQDEPPLNHDDVVEVGGRGRGRGRGRPPNDSDAGAMDGEALRERRRQLGRNLYQKEKISKVRREAVRQRRDRESIAVPDNESATPVDDPEMDGEDESLTPAEKELHPKTVLRKKAEF